MGRANQAKGEAIQDERYARAAASFGPAMERLSRAYEADPEQRLDLLQDIHFAIWRSFAQFDGQRSERSCPLRHVRAQISVRYLLQELAFPTGGGHARSPPFF